MKRVRAIPGLDPAAYQRSGLHSEDRIWVEKNCYVDVWIELIHALGLDPLAMLPFTIAMDFEGDQWTFFKPPHSDLWDLYGIDVQELNVWKPLIDHVREHLTAGKLISTEADAFWLPDTQGTDYRIKHTKTTIIIENLDEESGTVGYFHNAGYHQANGEDFRRLFGLEGEQSPSFMPLFAELIKINRLKRHQPRELQNRAKSLLSAHFSKVPVENPVSRFAATLEHSLLEMKQRGLDNYHAWAFATIRQLGAAAELSALHLAWHHDTPGEAYAGAGNCFTNIATASKTLILKAARAAASGKQLRSDDLLCDMSSSWEKAVRSLASSL